MCPVQNSKTNLGFYYELQNTDLLKGFNGVGRCIHGHLFLL